MWRAYHDQGLARRIEKFDSAKLLGLTVPHRSFDPLLLVRQDLLALTWMRDVQTLTVQYSLRPEKTPLNLTYKGSRNLRCSRFTLALR